MGGGKTYDPSLIEDYSGIIVIECFCIIGVNLFLLISGYFGIKLTPKSILKFLFICFSYKLLHILLSVCLGDRPLGLSIPLDAISVISHPSGWFVRCYFLLMLLSYPINRMLESVNKRELLSVLCILTFINVYLGFIRQDSINENGYTIMQFIYMYLLGHTLKVYNLKDALTKVKLAFIWLLSTLMNTALVLTFASYNKPLAQHFLGYNNPLIIISAIAVFVLFLKFRMQSKMINTIASGSFGIYLFHTGYTLWHCHLISFIAKTYSQQTTWAFLLTMSVFIMCMLLIGCTTNILINTIFNKIYNIYTQRDETTRHFI